MTFDVLKGIWRDLEGEPQYMPGLYERRVFARSGYTLFAGISRPGMGLRLTMSVPSSVNTEGLDRQTKGFSVQRQYNAAERATYVALELTESAFRGVFEVMAEDVAGAVVIAPDEAAAVAAMRDRLNRWERFMRTAGPEGLSREEQVGLFGELTFLRALLGAGIPAEEAVGAWKGPAGANQDFQSGDRVVEVKATVGNSATTARISSEMQLDDSDWASLYLVHLWLRASDGDGTTLPDLADAIASSLDGEASETFQDRLVDAGYHPVHRRLYERTGYSERHRRYYLVEADFPRLRRSDLRAGVSKVEYWIELVSAESFRCDEQTVLADFRGASRESAAGVS